ncbi:hypothetical protein LTR95_005821 [Oleoguttula sp. CCFEE 5521]
MDRTKWPALLGLVAGTYQLTSTIGTTFALEKPVHSSIALLSSLAAVLLVISRFLPRAEQHKRDGHGYNAVPLEDVHTDQTPRRRSSTPGFQDVAYPSSLRKLRLVFLLAVTVICARVAVLQHVLANIQCARRTWESAIPLVFGIFDYVGSKRGASLDTSHEHDLTLYGIWARRILQAPYRYLIIVGAICVACVIAITTTSSPATSYICATTLPYTWAVPLLQHVGTALDVSILACLTYLIRQDEGKNERSAALRFSTVGWALMISAIVLSISGGAYYFVSDPDIRRAIITIPSAFKWSAVKLDLLFCFTATCTLFCIYHIGTTTTTLVLLFTATMTSTTAFAWAHPHPFPIRSAGYGFTAASLAMFALIVYFNVEAVSIDSDQSSSKATFARIPTLVYLTILLLLGLRTALWVQHDSLVTYHPIDLLIWEAKQQHDAYTNQSTRSTSLDKAVHNYRTRYNRQPPPNFDKWYDYATERTSFIIDDFDSIERDLLPFYALSPKEIRERTWELISNPWNDAAGLSIRDGKVEISPHVVPTHRWMLDGLVEMIGFFAEWLPDMDLAFNLNDECRVAVPYEDVEPMRAQGRAFGDPTASVRNAFSPDRAAQWTPIPEEPITTTPLTELSFQRTFQPFGSVGCPPSSPARSQNCWSVASLCTTCTAPHSHGIALSNWTLAGNICHQPDVASLHGLYLSPAAFKGSHTLLPIFSQSKAHGFNDVLYPSAWNYMDKAVYRPSEEYPDPDWKSKNATLFWRGATSEGVSPGGGQWKGMTRQRFVHLASPNTTSPSQAILLPTSKSTNTAPRLQYTSLSPSVLRSLLPVDLQFVSSILRCGGRDCDDQAAEFAPLAEPSDFQGHWGYKYLLDLDGAGFSGRFLPFLHSKSLPFKAALFREWWDDRLTAWVHFVPLDIRGQGMWATLAYFAGVNGTIGGRSFDVEGRDVEGERIARVGREWAGKVLRREDMEIYFFRVLLEWGRLTDEGREGIGFSGADDS